MCIMCSFCTDQWYSVSDYAISKLVRCRKQCPGTTEDNVTWCINVWNYNKEVELCLNTSGYTNVSAMAEDARIYEHFRMAKVFSANYC